MAGVSPQEASASRKPPKVRPYNYKALKEAHVSNLGGGSIWEINEVTLVLPAAVLLWSVLQARLSFFTPYSAAARLVDFLIHCAAILFAITVYADQPRLLVLFLLAPAVLTWLTPRTDGARKKAAKAAKPVTASKAGSGSPDPLPIKPFVTMYRGHMMIITCAAILAVDFHAFPRRFAKVETWGTSLMDMGVGSFVFSAGVVAARPVLKAQLNGTRSTIFSRIRDAARHSLPLLALGLVRLWSVKGVDYAEHVTEYGVHWNFFFTLGLLPPFMAVCHAIFSLVPSYAALALLISGAYQVILETTHLKTYIFTAPRTDLISQNREGIFSFLGYLSIFLIGLDTGTYILPRPVSPSKPSNGRNSSLQKLLTSTTGRLTLWTLTWTALLTLTLSFHTLNLQISRRLANLPYILWVCAFNSCQLALCSLSESLCFPDLYSPSPSTASTERKHSKAATSTLLHAINRNGLLIFLCANVLTGLVNLTLPTLHMGLLQTMGVLVIYLACLAGIAWALDAWDISVKL